MIDSYSFERREFESSIDVGQNPENFVCLADVRFRFFEILELSVQPLPHVSYQSYVLDYVGRSGEILLL